MAAPRRPPGRGPGRGAGRGPGRGGDRRPERPSPETTALPLPESTAELLDTSRRPGNADNVGLWLDKFVYRRRHDWDVAKEYREYALAQFTRSWRSPLGQAVLARRWTALQTTHGSGRCIELHAPVQGRLLVDYGRASAVETALSFHHTWGVPRIPGSAIKGIALLGMREQEADDPNIAAEIEAIFGTQPGADGKLPKGARAGQVLFFDALPRDGEFRLAEDVLTPHYNPYYRLGEPPGDWHSPVPHTFLTVVDTTFVFHLAVQPLPGTQSATAETWLSRVHEVLSDALEWHGIGAKTAAGYGRFSKLEQPADPAVEELVAWFDANKRDRKTQREQLDLLRMEWRGRLLRLSKEDRERAAGIVRSALKSPKLTADRDAFLQELSKP